MHTHVYYYYYYLFIYLFFNQVKITDGSKITKVNKICLVVYPTLAGRHQWNRRAVKLN